MKEIKAYIREAMVDPVTDAIGKLPGPPGVTVLQVQAYGHRADGGTLEKARMAKLEVDVADDSFARVVDAILHNARTSPVTRVTARSTSAIWPGPAASATGSSGSR